MTPADRIVFSIRAEGGQGGVRIFRVDLSCIRNKHTVPTVNQIEGSVSSSSGEVPTGGHRFLVQLLELLC